MLDVNKIYCMDCFDGMEKLPDNSIDMVHEYANKRLKQEVLFNYFE